MENNTFWDTNIRNLKGVGEKRAEQFSLLGVDTVDALLHFYPRAYEDLSNPVPIFGAEVYDKCCVRATVSAAVTRRRANSGAVLFETSAYDSTGAIKILIFNNKYAAAKLLVGHEYLFYGKVTAQYGIRQILSPRIEESSTYARICPIYRTTKNLTSKYIEGCVRNALQSVYEYIEDPIPGSIIDEYNLYSLKTSLLEIHFPSNMERMQKARERFIFEELLELQLGLRLLKNGSRATTNVVMKEDFTDEFFSLLPFTPTNAQIRACKEAVKDLMSGTLMNRLLQGDVGSGKTMVSAALSYTMAKNGYQSAIMAPTEILARQHYETMKKFFDGTDIRVELLTGSVKGVNRRSIIEGLKGGEVALAVGTHALISDGTEFKNLGLVMTDEQHRFGVRQRAKLAEKGEGSHILVMSATPIPRTLALAIYGDLDVSIIDELPKGRVPIETYKIDSEKRERAYNYIKKHLDEGRQGYIVCPLVNEGETEELISAVEYYEKIKDGAFKDYEVGLLHGQMKADEKAEVMERFLLGEIQLLVSTVVIEVGVDVPNAAIMLIENAERFGLSQLHQLRGRVGRGSYKSTCILLSDNNSEMTKDRLRVMCETTDGFQIANRDLELRGPGDFFGQRQHGLPELGIADMMEDMNILVEAGAVAEKILSKDPLLSEKEHLPLKNAVEKMFNRMET
ncbi:MAG: ATP-dependent DNA helicase RecG [Oscillospiraceae bacterium]|nr:ATP-dependent DNA helicase RecG [Oscillospiraceae bacterium]